MNEIIETIKYGIEPYEIKKELKFELLTEPTEIPKGSGLYMIMSGDKVLYIGESSVLRRRVHAHMRGSDVTEKFMEEWTHILITKSEMNKNVRTLAESLLIEKYSPKYNTSDTKRLIDKYGSMEVVMDLVYYLRVVGLEFAYVAEEFNITRNAVENIAKKATASNIEVPMDYVPTKKLDMTRTRAMRSTITKSLFYTAYDYLQKDGIVQRDLTRLYGIPEGTINAIKKASTEKYKRWLKEREESELTTV
ncbi:GIY-YIG nuclease family protein [Priestia megaterium]|uniref:GIY-YIG nuclease family protein n=1 Tax=Priestia megaterium TaxID=1404 RepID=UPI00285AEB0F|nr:GIY-YIG nuclease family protein [Priestia megaterium]MDR7207576.1 putative GIY-YIG superfamily endonuclease/putative DNA-binding protein YlxM (UPF0122 family) [Priestia megaterium]